MNGTSDAINDISSLDAIEERLTRSLGAVVGGAALSRALGYPSQGAFRQAVARDRVPVRVFELEGRRGRFALTADIARWLWTQRSGNSGRDTSVRILTTTTASDEPIP